MVKRAFITGITGQDGSYLAELLLGSHKITGCRRVTQEEADAKTDHPLELASRPAHQLERADKPRRALELLRS